MSLSVTRFLLIVFCCYCGGFIALKGFKSIQAAVIGAAFGLLYSLVAIFLDMRIRKLPLKVIICGAVGTIIGLVIANLFAYSFLSYQLDKSYPNFLLYLAINGFFGYVGLAIGGKKGEEIETDKWPFGDKKSSEGIRKILDTSVIIDGRIADLLETGFIEGALILPQFVLRELVTIADSSDQQKRARGKRGLDIISRLQKQGENVVSITDQDFIKIKDVDDKLIALAKSTGAKIITNDYNLYQIADIQGIPVMSINQLAAAVKPIVLPGETLSVQIIKDGKEPGQGVANLDDGTMVIVDNGKKHIGRTVNVIVTSVLQTTTGRMIFAEIN